MALGLQYMFFLGYAKKKAYAKDSNRSCVYSEGCAARSSSDAYDLCVIGGGPGGYVAAIKAAQLGRDLHFLWVGETQASFE